MLELVAVGPQPAERAQQLLKLGPPLSLGREGEFAVPWDGAISRRHATLAVEAGRVRVQRLPTARNPIFYQGEALDDFFLAVGEQFVIGSTAFQLRSEPAHPTVDLRPPAEEHIFAAERLAQIAYRDAEKRIAVLGQLPELISSAVHEAELWQRITTVLLAGVDAAEVAAIAAVPSGGPVQVLDWDRRRLAAGPFLPSERLLRRAQETQQSIVHVWEAAGSDPAVTWDAQHAWAMAVPVRGAATGGWTLYLAGRFQADWVARAPDAAFGLQGDVKFAELVGALLANLRDLQHLERQAASWRAFFSPVVLQAIGTQDPRTVLAPRECELTVLFCDLQGFSRSSERRAADLLAFLQQVSRALSLATHAVLHHGGVIGDFHGDAMMGFWGWPVASEGGIELACRAALAIQQNFAAHGPELAGERCAIGIGIAAGRGVAGQIGSHDQVKVTAFGPVVNRAARLESLTRAFQVPILIDAACGERLARLSSPEFRTRDLGVVRPLGLTAAVPLAELLPGDQPAADWETTFLEGVRALYRGEWERAGQAWAAVPADFGPAAFYRQYLAEQRTPPTAWDGVVPMKHK